MNEHQKKLWARKKTEWMKHVRTSIRREVPPDIAELVRNIMCDAVNAGIELSKGDAVESWSAECGRYWNDSSMRKRVAKMMRAGRLEPTDFDAFKDIIISSFAWGYGRGLKERSESGKQTALF